jgi:hypothetical protein
LTHIGIEHEGSKWLITPCRDKMERI